MIIFTELNFLKHLFLNWGKDESDSIQFLAYFSR